MNGELDLNYMNWGRISQQDDIVCEVLLMLKVPKNCKNIFVQIPIFYTCKMNYVHLTWWTSGLSPGLSRHLTFKTAQNCPKMGSLLFYSLNDKWQIFYSSPFGSTMSLWYYYVRSLELLCQEQKKSMIWHQHQSPRSGFRLWEIRRLFTAFQTVLSDTINLESAPVLSPRSAAHSEIEPLTDHNKSSNSCNPCRKFVSAKNSLSELELEHTLLWCP
jgi:hypothetical protein